MDKEGNETNDEERENTDTNIDKIYFTYLKLARYMHSSITICPYGSLIFTWTCVTKPNK